MNCTVKHDILLTTAQFIPGQNTTTLCTTNTCTHRKQNQSTKLPTKDQSGNLSKRYKTYNLKPSSSRYPFLAHKNSKIFQHNNADGHDTQPKLDFPNLEPLATHPVGKIMLLQPLSFFKGFIIAFSDLQEVDILDILGVLLTPCICWRLLDLLY